MTTDTLTPPSCSNGGGGHPRVVQERMGHASIQHTLDIYSHVTLGLQEAAALRFDEGFENHVEGVVGQSAVTNP